MGRGFFSQNVEYSSKGQQGTRVYNNRGKELPCESPVKKFTDSVLDDYHTSLSQWICFFLSVNSSHWNKKEQCAFHEM
jgi:hypothetical protein